MARRREPLAKPPEVADYIGRSVRTLANWRSLGIGPAYLGGRERGVPVRYRWPDVDAWLKAQTTKTAS